MVEYRWLYIERIVVLKTHLLFCVPDFQLEPLPRKAIGDGDDVVRLLARIRRWYPGPIMDGDGKILTPTEALLNV